MTATIDATAVAALADEQIDWRYKGVPSSWWGHTPAQVCASDAKPLTEGAVGSLCVLSDSALTHNVETMAAWCRERGVELAPHGKTHMAPALLARQFAAGACAVTVATISQLRTYRAFGVNSAILANELVDDAGLCWLASELDADPDLRVTCWVDSVRGVSLMTAALSAAGTSRPVDVCVEVGVAGGRTGCRTQAEVDDVARAAVASDRLRLVGVAGYEATLGSDAVPDHLREMRSAVTRLAPLFETDEVVVTAGGSAYFDTVADELVGDWRTILRSGCYLTHDDGMYGRSSPLRDTLRAAMTVWAQVVSRPEADLALLTMGRRDVSFDHDLPVPYGMAGSRVTKLNDQHAYLSVGAADHAEVGDWVEFGISHPCTTFDKWQLIPVLDDEHRVVELVRTFF